MKLYYELPSFLRLCGLASLARRRWRGKALLQARIGGVELDLKDIEYGPIHSVFQIGARLATAGFRGVSRRLS